MPEPDSLLHVLTARKRVLLPALREISAELEEGSFLQNREPDNFRTYKLARFLDMLGHLEYVQKGRASVLFVAPSCLARLPAIDRCLYVLCGGRSAAAADEMASFTLNGRKIAQVSVSSRKSFPDRLLPNRVVVEFDDVENGAQMASGLGVEISGTPAGWSLACMSASCQDFESSLAWRARTLRNEELKFYDPERCGFVPYQPDSEGLGVRLDDPSFACIIRRDQEAVVNDLDWGRCWAHAEAGTSCLRYDRNRKLFAVPSRLPLPRLIARALALCSGFPPIHTKLKLNFISDQWLVFQDVPREVALKVTEKLGLPAVPTPLNDLQQILP